MAYQFQIVISSSADSGKIYLSLSPIRKGMLHYYCLSYIIRSNVWHVVSFCFVSTLLHGCKHLVTIVKMCLCRGYMASIYERMVIPIFGYNNLLILLLECFIGGEHIEIHRHMSK